MKYTKETEVIPVIEPETIPEKEKFEPGPYHPKKPLVSPPPRGKIF